MLEKIALIKLKVSVLYLLMARLLFHSDVLNERGTCAAIYEYCKELQKMGHEITWAFPVSPLNDDKAIKFYGDLISMLPYENFFHFKLYCNKKFDWAYFVKKGFNDGVYIPKIPNNVHVAFNYYQPHGDKYAYVSKWLANAAAKQQNFVVPSRLRKFIPNVALKLDWVPYAVQLPNPNDDYRNLWGIPEDATICLRFGGYNTFDIPWVHNTISKILEFDKSFYFVGVNTKPFTSHKRAIFLPEIIGTQLKSNMINTADVVLHGRRQGESFGMSILESINQNASIFAWFGGWDRNHVELLEYRNLYLNRRDLQWRLLNKFFPKNSAWSLKVAEEFKPSNVIKQFIEVFGHDIL